MAKNSSRLKKRSLVSAYFEATRLYLTNFHRYLPAIFVPAVLLFFLDQSKAGEYWLEHPSAAGFVVLFIDFSTVFLLSGILGHITSHIYVGHKTDTWETLGSALRLVPAEFAAGIISALPLFLVIYVILKWGELRLLIWFPIFAAVSIVSSIVVEAEGIKNPFRATWRTFQLIFAKDKHFSNSLRIVGVVFINFVVVTVLAKAAWIKLVLKLSVEPVFEIVYGLLYFNLRFQEGPFDITVLAQQLASETQRPAEVAPAGGR